MVISGGMRISWKLALMCWAAMASAQRTVTMRVDTAKKLGSFPSAWSYFGYDEANFTYAANGRKLIQELAALSREPVHIRTHFLLTNGDGEPGLKWGFTNAYREDAAGRPVYNWTTLDRILGTYVSAGAKPIFEIGFMPRALSARPDPYEPVWKPGEKNDDYAIGWTYPPKDYAKWSELVFQAVRHCVEHYGRANVAGWEWEVWNEPNIFYWHGTAEEYDKLYDFTAAAVRRALPEAKIGGPASTSPRDPKAAAFLKQFLEHCAAGRNYATGGVGAPLDFISYHAKGQPKVVDGRVQMGLAQELQDTADGFAIVRSFAAFRELPIILSEADPEGCAACSAQVYPQNAYRNGTLYPAYEAAVMKAMLELAGRDRMRLEGILTWAFEFENQPYFAGFRSLATNGVDKPVLNFFRMAGLMQGDRVQVESDGAVPLETMISNGVRQSEVDGLAARSMNQADLMIWNYRDEDSEGAARPVRVVISGLPKGERILMRHFRIDAEHSNAYTAWKKMGSPQTPTAAEQIELESRGQLEMLRSPEWVNAEDGETQVRFSLPGQAISLLEFSW